ncbi:type II CAAX endopeptidase family protein [soil metagenome]
MTPVTDPEALGELILRRLYRRRRRRRRARMAALSLLGLSNWAANTWVPDRAYVPWNLSVAAGLVVLARRVGIRDPQMGLGRAGLADGVRDGAAVSALVALGYGGLLRSRLGRTAFADERATALSTSWAAYQGLVRIPLGTVVAEEIVFRGVLPALLDGPRWSPWQTESLTAVLFGLWHVLPSRQLHLQNDAMREVVGGTGATGAIVAAVVSTAAAHVVLDRLRRRSGHLVAPILVHLAVNGLGFAGARLVGRQATAPEVGRRL